MEHEEIIKLYQKEGLSLRALAQLEKVSHQQISNILKLNGVNPRQVKKDLHLPLVTCSHEGCNNQFRYQASRLHDTKHGPKCRQHTRLRKSKEMQSCLDLLMG